MFPRIRQAQPTRSNRQDPSGHAAFYLMAGANLYDLQKNLGHHSVAFTAEIYGHLSADHRVREATRVSYPMPTESAKVIFAGKA
jgi:hypothetical protein